MKNLLLSVLLISTLVLTGCIQDDDTPIIVEVGSGNVTPVDSDAVVNITGAITSSTTWTNDKIYQLNQKVVV